MEKKKWKAFKYETNTLWKINLPNQWSRNERTILSTFSFTGVLCSWKTVTGKTSPFLSSWKWLTAKKCPSQKTSVRLRYPTTHLSLTRPNTDPPNSLSLPYKWLVELFCPTDQWEQTASYWNNGQFSPSSRLLTLDAPSSWASIHTLLKTGCLHVKILWFTTLSRHLLTLLPHIPSS